MQLPLKVIEGKDLMERWGMSMSECLCVTLNHDIDPVGKFVGIWEWEKIGWDTVIEVAKESKKKINLSEEAFSLSDITEFEERHDSLLNEEKRKVLSVEQLTQRWGLGGLEVEDILDNCAAVKVDPLGFPLKEEVFTFLLMEQEVPTAELLYRLDEVERIEAEYTELKARKQAETSQNVMEELEEKGEKHENGFWHKGDFWLVKFKGNKFLLKDLERVRYVIHLINNPRKNFSVTELVRLVKKEAPVTENETEVFQAYSEMTQKELEKEGLSIENLRIEGLSDEDLKAVKNVASDSWNELINAKRAKEQDRIDKSEKKWQQVRTYLRDHYGVVAFHSKKGGLGFKLKGRLNPEINKIRLNVKNQIKDALKNIRKYNPPLYEHLFRSITTGKECTYNPDPNQPIDWYISWDN